MGLERKNNSGGQLMTPRSRSQRFPSLRGGMTWGKIIDLDFLFQSPQKDARIIGGMEVQESSCMSTMEINFELYSHRKSLGKKAPFIGQENCPS
jgi:hypothetical protein